MNVIFSTTRQWNPGDEFILMGCMNLLKEHLGEFNPVIYNRNPQIRRHRKYDLIKSVDNALGKDFIEKFNDNSVKDRLPMDYADMVIFAGSPEWRGMRTQKLYSSILEYNLPTLFLGLGTNGKFEFNESAFSKDEMAVFKKAKVVTCRDQNTTDGLSDVSAKFLPCPALFSSPTESLVKKVKRIGLIYGTNNSAKNNNVSKETYEYLMQIYNRIITEFGSDYEIEFVAHYIDELSEFKKDFPEQKLRYSFDSKDYLDIYSQYDLIIGYRVHGVGMCASMGIPGIMIAHDPRAVTVKGFKAKIHNVGEGEEKLIATTKDLINNIEELSSELLEHKKETKQKYLQLFSQNL
ncbi:polysaccharide pyruvyl transferase family protein [Vibrio algarum]|uniref:Polysaccharide pyruvyl transferase family protein n=1 Tax=Vibrio algarum TaxID=3020714 RepID=A0ABT4YLS2_9VIBR|nr:polysaccharide pyruvyl transferase family protein [Vibrio sp. KJ40-1]MDB1122448.1 polysaccharide pyruvyl transferase family protein [Vibrio sp. KJ40-1]